MPRIHDLPDDERPREKLARDGAAALDDSELLALFLRTGTKGRSAIEIGRDLITKHGSLGALGRLGTAMLAKEHGLGLAKACQLAAAFELGARVARESVKELTLDSPPVIHSFLAPQLAHLPHESLRVILVNARLRHVSTIEISRGGISETVAHPREILRPVITHAAHGFILAHNHPSGDPAPSKSDREMTQRIREAAELMQVRFIDHIIIGRPAPGREPWFSFRSAGLL